jgi:hypothetical protein
MGTLDRVTNAALIGSARAATDDALPPATPEGALVGSLAETNPEQRLLLAAGVRAIYRMAGYTPERLDAPLEPAPAETKAVCLANVADLIHQLLIARESNLLQEALGRMIAARLVLPPEMLPLALGSATVAQRPLVAQVAGERGAWLGSFNSAWSWVRESLAHSLDEMPSDADTIWQEGTSADRLQVLERWRAADPAKARDEIAAVWRQEKADFRVGMVEALADTLSSDDEALLETALDDRSGNVRAVAQRLLARIPGSAYRARAIARADTFLTMGKKKLATALPEAHEKSWERDGIVAKPRQGMGERSWWLMQIVAVTPPAHWVERFGIPPADLIAAATDEHGAELLEGWSRAAVLYDASDWIQPLVEAWSKRLGKRASGGVAPLEMCELLLPKLPLPALEAMALKILRHGESKQDIAWETLVAALPRPWSAELAREWLASLRAFARDELASLKSYAPDWRDCSEEHATLLPAECLDEALSPWEMDEYANNRWQANSWREQHERFLKAVRQRQRIRDEIPGASAP